jgi:hypothetical protein
MNISPAPSVTRGQPVLQPAYFTSWLYVDALREDIILLVQTFYNAYEGCQVLPFAIFKAVWRSQAWPWLHFKVLDNRSREAFLRVTLRLFLGTVFLDCIENAKQR